MAVYQCKICGAIIDEEKEGRQLQEYTCCPVCQQPLSAFQLMEKEEESPVPVSGEHLSSASPGEEPAGEDGGPCRLYEGDLSYSQEYAKPDGSIRYMDAIHQMAVSGKSIDSAMGTTLPMPGWDSILLLGAQLNPSPLNDGDPVDTTTVIGRHAAKPMVLESPVYISHMSFGALSKETKVALALGSAQAKTAMCSGEGGILPEERDAAYKYIFEYVPNKYSVTDENLKRADAIEIKIGQGTKPGMGGHLPGEKVTPEIAALRGKAPGQDVQSPSKFPELQTKEDLKDMVSMLRQRSEGRPIGFKIAAGRIE